MVACKPFGISWYRDRLSETHHQVSTRRARLDKYIRIPIPYNNGFGCNDRLDFIPPNLSVFIPRGLDSLLWERYNISPLILEKGVINLQIFDGLKYYKSSK